MTANQLQLQSNKISQQMADENARHNEATENEINRTNLVNERIRQAQVDLDAERLRLQNEWESEKRRIQEQYNYLSLELQKSQGDRANDIKEEANALQEQYQYMEALHLSKMDAINQQEADIKQQLADENERHNMTMEGIDDYKNALQYKKNQIDEEYNKMMNSYYNGVLANQQIKMSQDYYLGTAGLLNSVYNTQISLFNAQTNRARQEQDKIFGIISGATSLVKSVGDAVAGATLGLGKMQSFMFNMPKP